jgi:hypothetical protein
MNDNPPWHEIAAKLIGSSAALAVSWWEVRRLEAKTSARLEKMASGAEVKVSLTEQQSVEREALRVAGDWSRRVSMPILTVIAVPIVLIGLIGGILTGNPDAVLTALVVLGFGSLV